MQYYKQNIELKKEQFGEKHPKYARAMVNFANHRFTSDSDNLHLLERSVKSTYKAIQSTIAIAEQDKIEDFEARAFAFAEQNKSVLLSETVQNDKAHVFADLSDSLAQREPLLQEEYANLYQFKL